MEHQPPQGEKYSNKFIITSRQFKRLVVFADDVKAIKSKSDAESHHMPDYEILGRLLQEENHIWPEMYRRQLLGPQTLISGITLGAVTNPVIRDRTITTLFNRGLVPGNSEFSWQTIDPLTDQPHETIADYLRRLLADIRDNAANKVTSIDEQKSWVERFALSTAEAIARGDEGAAGIRLLGMGAYWGATDQPEVRYTLQRRIQEEYVQ